MEERVFKIKALLESVQPQLRAVVHPQRTFKESVCKALSSSAASSSESRLADAMTKNGQRLGGDSVFGRALVDYGDAMGRFAEANAAMEEEGQLHCSGF